ncbi:MAG: alpha/beta hydrolase [Devosia sp.]|nr:alpha/beta hydrolase [Devosia sp.]
MPDHAPDLFRTRNFVPDFDRYTAQYKSRSVATRSRLRSRLDVPYGKGPAERLDLFFPEHQSGPAPVHLFIHGGYWRMFAKEDFSFVADTVTAAGGIAAILDYALMPAVRMEAIVGQVRRAVQWLGDFAGQHGGDPSRLTISGHSAGAQLCCWLLDASRTVPVQSALLVSGIYDLAPLQHSFLQPEIGLTDDEIARWSPLRASFSTAAKVTIMVGQLETAPFHDQADEFAKCLGGQHVTIPDANHMSIALDLGSPMTLPGQMLERLVRQDIERQEG